MSNSIDIQKYKNTPKHSGTKKYSLTVLCISSLTFLLFLYFYLFGDTGKYASEEHIGGFGSQLLGVSILLTLLAKKIEGKYRIGAILLTTIALILVILGFGLLVAIFIMN